MKNLLLVPIFALLLFSFQANSQCCLVSKSDKTETQKEVVSSTDTKTVNLKITGMTCVGCSNHGSNALKNLSGVLEQSIEYPEDVATIKYDKSKTNPTKMIKAIEKVGYKAEITNTKPIN